MPTREQELLQLVVNEANEPTEGSFCFADRVFALCKTRGYKAQLCTYDNTPTCCVSMKEKEYLINENWGRPMGREEV